MNYYQNAGIGFIGLGLIYLLWGRTPRPDFTVNQLRRRGDR